MKVAVAAVAVCAVLAAAGRDELRGRIAAVDSAAETIEVSGVKILARGAVIEDEQDRRIPLADLKAGDGIEVDGAFNAAGELAATKIERDSSPGGKIEGAVSAADAAARTITVGGVAVRVPEGARIEDRRDAAIPFEKLSADSRVECEGNWGGAREFTASKVELE